MSIINDIKYLTNSFKNLSKYDKICFTFYLLVLIVLAKWFKISEKIEIIVLFIVGFVLVSLYFKPKVERNKKDVPSSIRKIYQEIELPQSHQNNMIQIIKSLKKFKKYNKSAYKQIINDIRIFYTIYGNLTNDQYQSDTKSQELQNTTQIKRSILNEMQSLLVSIPANHRDNLISDNGLQKIVNQINSLMTNDLNNLIGINNQDFIENPSANKFPIEDSEIQGVGDVTFSENYTLH